MSLSQEPDGAVVLGVDTQPADIRQGLRFAATEAVRRRVPLRLVHGCAPLPMPTTLEPTTPLYDRETYWLKRLDLLAEAAEEIVDAPITVEVRVGPGTGVHILVDESAAASLIVVQARAASAIRRIATGSTSAMVSTRSLAPTAVIPAHPAELGPGLGVAVGIDASGSLPALDTAFREAELRHTVLTVVRGWGGHGGPNAFVRRPLDAREFKAEHDNSYDDLVAGVRRWGLYYPTVHTHVELRNQAPAEALLAASRTAQLLVVGRHRHGHLMPGALGHTVRRCLAQAACPVVVTPAVHEMVDAGGPRSPTTAELTSLPTPRAG